MHIYLSICVLYIYIYKQIYIYKKKRISGIRVKIQFVGATGATKSLNRNGNMHSVSRTGTAYRGQAQRIGNRHKAFREEMNPDPAS